MQETLERPNVDLTPNERILLESACVELIGTLEHLLEKAALEREAGFLGESAVIGRKMLLALVDFAEGYLSGNGLSPAFQQIARGYKSAQHTIDLATSQSWGPLRKLAGQSSASNTEVAQSHFRTGQAIAAAAESAVGEGIGILSHCSSVVDELDESLRPVLAELRETW